MLRAVSFPAGRARADATRARSLFEAWAASRGMSPCGAVGGAGDNGTAYSAFGGGLCDAIRLDGAEQDEAILARVFTCSCLFVAIPATWLVLGVLGDHVDTLFHRPLPPRAVRRVGEERDPPS